MLDHPYREQPFDMTEGIDLNVGGQRAVVHLTDGADGVGIHGFGRM
jgi:hypothetical protein